MKLKKNDIAVIGLGTFGYELAVQLEKRGHSVMAIDIDKDKINHIKDFVSLAIQADVTDEDVLRKIEIDKFDTVVFGMSSALESLILSITLMNKLHVKHIIGKANTQIQKEVLLKIGAHEVILPEIATAIRLADRITNPNILEKFELDAEQSLVEMVVPKKFFGKSLKELDVRKNFKVNVIMKQNEGKMEMITNADEKFREGDIIFVVGKDKDIQKNFSDL